MRAHIFDLDTLVKLEQYCWIVDKTKPNIPLLKISQSDFKLIKSGIYKNQGNKVDFNGITYWLSSELSNKLKVKLKISHSSLGNLGISMQEFLNKDIIDDMKPEFLLDNILHLKNSNDDIFVVCSRQTKNNYLKIIEKLEQKLKEEGLQIKNFYYISETFYDQNSDDIKYKKIRLLLQHLTGYKNDDTKFINEEVEFYNVVEFYDNQFDTLKIADEVNTTLKMLLKKTEDGLKSVIKEDISENKPVLVVNQISENLVNKKVSKKVNIEYLTFLKTFESFKLNRINETNTFEQKKEYLNSLIKIMNNKMEYCEDLKELEMYNYDKIQSDIEDWLDECNILFFENDADSDYVNQYRADMERFGPKEEDITETLLDNYIKSGKTFNSKLADILDKL